MPIYESACRGAECQRSGAVEEHYYPSHDSAMQACRQCGREEARYISTFAVVWTGPITARYNDRSKEYAHRDGYTAWRKQGLGGKPEPVRIETWQQQREHCRSEGLFDPREIGPVEVGGDGKSSSSRGLPGCWT